jgi:class 3 adenylate cyclase
MSVANAPPDERLAYRFVAAVDVEGFSRLDVWEQLMTQIDLKDVLQTAADQAALNRHDWETQVAGDGELAVLPADTDGLRLIADYPQALAEAIKDVNRGRQPRPRLRIRLALHHGTVAPGPFGPVGSAPIVVSRLLESDALRRRLVDDPQIDLAVVVSALLYHDLIRSRFRGLEPSDFTPILFDTKGAVYSGYLQGAHR